MVAVDGRSPCVPFIYGSDDGVCMNVRVNLLPTRKETKLLDLEEGATVEHMIRSIGLLPDGWIAVRSDEPVPLDERLEDEDEIDLVSVVSGG